MNFDEVLFLSEADIVELHARVLRNGGGSDGLRDRSLLLSAVARPQSGFGGTLAFPTLAAMAAVYADGIAKNHPFVDANKRTGYAAMILFLAANGFRVEEDPSLPSLMERLASKSGGVSFEEFVAVVARLMGSDVTIDH